MELLLIRGFETVAALAAILTVGALLGAAVGRLTFGAYLRKGQGKLAAHDRLHDDYGIRGAYTPEANKLPPPPPVDLHREIARAILQDRSERSRKGWGARRRERERQRDADIIAMIKMGKREAGETQTGKGQE